MTGFCWLLLVFASVDHPTLERSWSADEIIGEGTAIFGVTTVGMIGDRDCEDNDAADVATPFVFCMLSKLLPIAPNESSVFAESGLTCVLREGDLGRVDPVKRPLNADTDLWVLAWERIDNGDDLDDRSGPTTD
jgi:hypothetical protein